MNNSEYYGAPQRGLPRPTSSGTLSDSFENQNAKRQKVNGHQRPLYSYAHASNINMYQAAPYYPQHPQLLATTQGTTLSTTLNTTAKNHNWSPQPYYLPNNDQPVTQNQTPIARKNEPIPAILEIKKDDSEDQIQNELEYAKNGDNDDDSRKTNSDFDSDADEDNHISAEEKSITVPGTSITLKTEADITKWRSERKKMWLLKISNNKLIHMDSMGIKECELKAQKSVLQESKKQKQFIKSIQNQVTRINPKSNLNVRMVQREMAQENLKLLQFIKQLGDANLLKHELTGEQKEKLFGTNDFNSKDKRGRYHKNNYTNGRINSSKKHHFRHPE